MMQSHLVGVNPALVASRYAAVLDPNDRGADANELAVSMVLDGGRSTAREGTDS